MYNLPPDRKRYLLQQNLNFRSNASFSKNSLRRPPPTTSVSYGPSSATSILPLVPQLTGNGGLLNRLSIAGWGAGNATTSNVSSESKPTTGKFDFGPASVKTRGKAQMEKAAESMEPLQSQGTGGLWSSWWASSGGDKSTAIGVNKDTSMSAKWYVDGIRAGKATDSKLVKHLISLRVHLSTAKLVWIEEFLIQEQGMDALSLLLTNLVGKGGKERKHTDIESTVLLETVKCLRVLLNTEVRWYCNKV